MKRILINATQNEEIRVALCKGNHLYDFDLENRTREQKKSNIYKGHVTRVEPSLEAVFVEYGSQRQGFLPIREISSEYLSGNPRDENVKKLIKEGDELIVQVEKEERGNKGAALSTYVSLAGRYLVLMPNNPRGGGISRQISGKLREDMKRMLSNLDLQKGMSVIIRTAGIGKTQEDLQHDLNHLLNIWQAIQEQNKKYPSPRLVHQEAGVVTRAVRDYLRDDISEIWIDNENAYVEAAGFIDAVMPTQAEKLRKYTDYEPMFSRFNIEKQIETAYQREVRLPSGGSIVIDQTEALVSIDINSAKSTKGSDVAETAYHTNLEAADEIARQLRLRDMGGLIVIDFIDMNDNKHQKEVEKRLIDATKYDRARVQFGDISKFGLMEMSRQRLRPSLEESTGYICPRCHGNGMIRDLRSLSLSIMRQIEQIALKERQGEVQAEVPTDIAAFLLNEKRDSLVYLEQDSGTRITILPHAHLESPNFKLHFNRDGFAPTSYERITDTQQQEHSDLGYDVDWQTAEKERPEQQPTRQPRQSSDNNANSSAHNQPSSQQSKRAPQQNSNQNGTQQTSTVNHSNDHRNNSKNGNDQAAVRTENKAVQSTQVNSASAIAATAAQPQAVAWLSNLFAQAPQAQTAHSVSSRDAAEAIEALVNTGAQSLGSFGQVDSSVLQQTERVTTDQQSDHKQSNDNTSADRQQARRPSDSDDNNQQDDKDDDRRRRKPRKSRASKPHQRKDQRHETDNVDNSVSSNNVESTDDKPSTTQDKRDDNRQSNERNRNRQTSERNGNAHDSSEQNDNNDSDANEQTRAKRKPHSQRSSRGTLERGETLSADTDVKVDAKQNEQQTSTSNNNQAQVSQQRNQNPNEVILQVNEAPAKLKSPEIVHLSLDDSKPAQMATSKSDEQQTTAPSTTKNDSAPSNTESRHQQSNDNQSAEQQTAVVDKSVDSTQSTDSKTSLNEQPAPKSSADDKTSTVAEGSTATAPTENQQIAKANADVDVDADTKTTASVKDSTPQNSTVENDTIENDTIENSTTDNHSALELTHKALFAKRYVTADKFGQASNDPRVVRSQQAKTQAPIATNEQVGLTTSVIHGTVGEFIHSMLTDAETRLANEGVISSFIAAVALHNNQALAAVADSNNIQANAADDSSFDFINYGYQTLTADYLTRFNTMIQAVSQFAAAQGKTAVEPRAIGQRASNDPRGQHPDYAQNQQQDQQQDQEHATLNVPDEQQAEQVNQVVQSQDATDKQTDADDNSDSARNVTATALTGEVQADDISAESKQLLEADQTYLDEVQLDNIAADDNEAVDELSVKDDGQAGKSKTTIASYKNMIENVAEQLSPQKGMFNLTTPKVPRARTRKPKTEHKKPTQAEKAEMDSPETNSIETNRSEIDISDDNS